MEVSDGDSVTIAYTGRLDDGTVFDTSDEGIAREAGLHEETPDRTYKPLEVKVGSERVIPGVEEVLVGMEVGEKKTITVPPERAYGEHTTDRVASYDREAFDEMIDGRELVEGFEVETTDGLPGRVVDFGAEEVTVDFNHELAGERLTFDIEVLDIE